MSNSKIINSLYSAALRKRKLLSAADEKALFEKVAEGDMKSRNKLVEHNMRLAAAIALRSTKKSFSTLDIDDVISMANIGLIKAIDKFDINLGYKFSTYATWWIEDAIKRTSNTECNQIYIPIEVSQKIKVVNAISNRLSNELCRAATHEEIAAEAKMTVKKVSDLLSYSYTMVSGEDKDEDNSLSEFDTIASEENIENKIIDEQIQARIKAAINSNILDSKDKMIIKCLNGLDDTQELSLKEIAQLVGLSRERVRQRSVAAYAAIAAKLSDIEVVVPAVKIARKKKSVVALEALDLLLVDVKEEVIAEVVVEAEYVMSVDLSTTAVAEESIDMVIAAKSKSSSVSFELLPFWNDQLKNSAKLMLSTSAALLGTEVNLYEPARNISLDSSWSNTNRPDMSQLVYLTASDQRSVLSAGIAAPGEPMALSNALMSDMDFIRSASRLNAKKSSWTSRRLTNHSPGHTNNTKAKVIAIEDVRKDRLDTLIANNGHGERLVIPLAFRSRTDILAVPEHSITGGANPEALGKIFKFPEKLPAKAIRQASNNSGFYQTAFSPGSAFDRYPGAAYSSA